MIPGGGNHNPNMGMPPFGMPGTGIISAPPIITGSRIAMGIPMMGGIIPGGSIGMMPNNMMAANPIGQGMFQGQVHQGIPHTLGGVPHTLGGVPNQLQPQPEPVEYIEPALRKVFVKSIPEDVTDAFMENILKECGNIVQWKRSKNEKDIPVSFGTCEFEAVEGVLRCLRIMNNLKLLGNELQINSSDRTVEFIDEWAERKKKEWLATKKNGVSREEDFERYLQKDDAKALENIYTLIENFDVNKVREEREKEGEKKEHPREKERDRKKKMYQKEQEKIFQKELRKWLDFEEKMERDRRKDAEREKEREHEKEKMKQRLLEKELEYDSEEERRRKSNTKNIEQQKKRRQKEIEDDNMDRRRELMEEEKKIVEEGQIDIEPPPENIIPVAPQEEDNAMRIEPPLQANPKPRASKFSVITVEPEQQAPAPQRENIGAQPFQIEVSANKPTTGPANVLFNQEDAQEDQEAEQLFNRKYKIQSKAEKPTELVQNVVTMDRNKKEATIKFGVVTPAENQPADSKKALLDLGSLVSQIPKNKTDLFNYPINWVLLATSDLVEQKVKPWLCKQSKELLGQEEMDFVNVVLKRLANRESPYKILEKVEKLLDEEAEDFMMKLWRVLIFELLKLEKINE